MWTKTERVSAYLSVRERGGVEVGLVDDGEDDGPGGDVLLGAVELRVVHLPQFGRLRRSKGVVKRPEKWCKIETLSKEAIYSDTITRSVGFVLHTIFGFLQS